MQISDEELIAYLLGDAAPEQRRLIEKRMSVDTTLYERVGQLRLLLGQLDSLQLNYEPPADLFARTLARIEEIGESASVPSGQSASQPIFALPSNVTPATLGASRRSAWDSTALIVCMTVLCCLLLPTILRARFEARRTQCAHNLGFLGRGLADYAFANAARRYPEVSATGLESFAGIYAVKLFDAGLLDSPSQVQCASLFGCKPIRGEMELDIIPTLAQLQRMDLRNLEVCRNAVGGDYAYSLGVVEDGKPVPLRCEGNSHLAIMADTPIIIGGQEQLIAHDGLGVNVLFEDGHVSFVRTECRQNANCDDPFLNLIYARAAGLNKQDACLGPSHFGPVGND